MKKYILLILYLTIINIYAKEDMTNYTIIKDEAKTKILTPTLQNIKTLKLRLKNGLEAYIISDPDCDKSGAAMSVDVGSWSDPEKYPGTAHFLEHMLFLGSEKYPQESGFANFINNHGGSRNAYTANDYTVYMFSVNNDAIEESLKRFADFFIAPLFNKSGIDREINAVDQEFKNYLEVDGWRQMQIFKEISNQNHPNSKFSIGNLNTLSKIPISVLKKWYTNHYSANLMHLVVYSNQPIEELKTIVSQNFKDIKNINTKPIDITQEIMSKDSKGHILYIEPIKKTRRLSLMWELPGKFANTLETKPEQVIGHILGDEGENSLLANLKENKLAEALSAGGYDLGPNNFIFQIDIKLTKKGLKQYETVIKKCFQAINNIKGKDLKYIFDETASVAKNNYQYKSREDIFDTVMQHASKIRKENISTYPEKTLIPQKYSIELTKELVDNLTPQNCLFSILADPQNMKIELTNKEKWIGGKYALKPIETKKLSAWLNEKPNPKIKLPAKNIFIPENMNIICKKAEKNEELPHPTIINDDNLGKIYYQQDKRYLVPENMWSCYIKTPAANGSAKKLVLMELYAKSLKEQLRSLSYPATTAGLYYQIRATPFGIKINLFGFNDKMNLLFLEIIKNLKKVKPTKEQFETYKDELKTNYKNIQKDMPYKQAMQKASKILRKNFFTNKEKYDEIKKIDYEQFKKFTPKIFKETYTEGLFYGNLAKKEAINAWESLKKTLKSRPYNNPKKEEVVSLPNSPLFVESKTKMQGNALLLIIDDGPFSFENRAAQNILSTAVSNAFFDELRTKQQTGYLTQSWEQEIERKLFNLFVVQSNSHTTKDLLSRFELFLETYLQEMGKTTCTQEEFETIRKAIITELKQPPSNLQEMGYLLKLIAFDYDGDFNWREKRIKALEKLTYDKFKQLSYEFLSKENKRRLAIMIDGTLPKENTLQYSPAQSIEKVRQLSTYNPK